ncbi:MAG: hypothetical protein M3Q64_03690, partial [bacterium]|nr:hypothetical protein [bacterium]
VTLSSVEQLQKLDVGTFRELKQETLLIIIHDLVQKSGYFSVLQHIEASPLYKAYIESGKNKLAGKITQNKSLLTQEEFERVVDILRDIRVNRG